ncbi:hypothetical protein EV702DRAFT_1102097 [Suillus placidus]|uniref:Uncharacterized protein n=1 Tax=Suillus placidus TaxID=48579 RepID=A0A9P7D313_9AGAM|nr:hypothetical protein EV702DRAFT_1102097 [Suillus placidus]
MTTDLPFTLVYLWRLSYSLPRPSCPVFWNDSDSSRLPPQRVGLERHSRNYYDGLAWGHDSLFSVGFVVQAY